MLVTASEPVLGPLQYVAGVASPAVKNGRGVKLTTNLHEVPKVKTMLYTHSILRLS
jgi:hypothetical protein